MGSGVFIVGTDTSVGKTVVMAGLLHCLREAGADAVPMKPVQTGAETDRGRLVAQDLRFSLQTIGYDPPKDELQLMNPYCFAMACSPHLAAAAQGTRIEISRIAESLRRLQESHDAVIVEGAGGLLVPIDESQTMIDVMREMSVPVVVVARRGLGTINHTLLTISELRSHSVEVLGVILNEAVPDRSDMIAHNNLETIEQFGAVPVLGSIEYLNASSDDGVRKEIVRVFRQSVPGWKIVLERLRAAQ